MYFTLFMLSVFQAEDWDERTRETVFGAKIGVHVSPGSGGATTADNIEDGNSLYWVLERVI